MMISFQLVNDVLKTMLGTANTKDDSVEVSDGENSSDDEEKVPLMLPHWTFIPGDRRYYLIIVKPMNSTLGVTLNTEGKIVITVTHDKLKEVQEMAARCIKSSSNIFETRFQKFTRETTITPTLPLRNEPMIHEKENGTISISFPIEEHNVAETIYF